MRIHETMAEDLRICRDFGRGFVRIPKDSQRLWERICETLG